MDRTTARKWARRMAERIYEIYGAKPWLVTDEAVDACQVYIVAANEAGDNPKVEAENHFAWLEVALKKRKEHHPAFTPDRACINVQQDAGKAAAWSKFKREKTGLLQPKPNPYLDDDRPPEAIPTPDELEEFRQQMRQTLQPIARV